LEIAIEYIISLMPVSTTTKKIASNTIYQIIGKIFSLSITIITTMIVTRFYGREGYGAFSLMQNWPALFFIIVDFGINAIATRELSKNFSNVNQVIGNIFLIRVFLSLFFIVTLGIGLLFFPYSPELSFGIRLGLAVILTQSLFTTTNIIFQVKLRYDFSTIGYIVGYIFILSMVLIFSLLKLNISWVNFTYVVGGFITFIVNIHFLNRLGVYPDLTFNSKICKELILESLPLGLMFIFSQINFRSDSILLSVLPVPSKYGLNNTETVAVYSLPYKIFDVALVIPTFFMNSVYPVLVQHMQHGKEKIKSTFFRSIKFLILASILGAILGFIFSPLAISFLGGSEFYQSILVLRILVSGLILYYLTQPIAWLIVTLGKQKHLPYIYFISTLINVGLNMAFIPRYSFYASAVITHVSEFAILIMLSLSAHKAWKDKYETV